MSSNRKTKLILPPERKSFGWSYYQERVTCMENSGYFSDTMAEASATIEGKKLCLFGRFIWDYKIGVINYEVNSCNSRRGSYRNPNSNNK